MTDDLWYRARAARSRRALDEALHGEPASELESERSLDSVAQQCIVGITYHAALEAAFRAVFQWPRDAMAAHHDIVGLLYDAIIDAVDNAATYNPLDAADNDEQRLCQTVRAAAYAAQKRARYACDAILHALNSSAQRRDHERRKE